MRVFVSDRFGFMLTIWNIITVPCDPPCSTSCSSDWKFQLGLIRRALSTPVVVPVFAIKLPTANGTLGLIHSGGSSVRARERARMLVSAESIERKSFAAVDFCDQHWTRSDRSKGAIRAVGLNTLSPVPQNKTWF